MDGKELQITSPSKKNIFSYAVGDLYGGGAFFIIGALFLVFLTDVAKLNPALAGTIIFVGKLWDAVSDPTMGYISDNTRSKYGRRRLYFLIGIVPIFLSWVLLWTSIDTSSTVFQFIYYLLIYLLFNTVFTLVMVPYNSMPAEMTTLYKDRSKLVTIRMLFSQMGMLLGAVLPITIINYVVNNLDGNLGTGYFIMATIFGLIFSVPWIFVYKGTYERDIELPEVPKRSVKNIAKKIAGDFGSTLRNKSLKIHSVMYISAFVSMDVFNALLIYYIRDDLNKYGSYQVLLGIVVVVQMLSLFVVLKLCNRFGNGITYRIHAATWVGGILLLFLLGSSSPTWAILLVGMVIGFGLSGCVMTPYNMLAFVVDADQLITKERREGIYAGMMTFLRKIAQALALFFVGIGLDLVGYQQPIDDIIQTQSLETLQGIRMMFFITPLLLLIIGIIASYKFKITPTNHQVLVAEINRLAKGEEKETVDKNTKEIVEEITGLDYQDLWKDGVSYD